MPVAKSTRRRALLRGAVYVIAAAVAASIPAGSVSAATGPYMVEDINAPGSSEPEELTNFNGVLIFSARGGSRGRELWRSDGTAEGTRRVKDIKPGTGGSGPLELTVVGDLLFFSADDGTFGRELWVTDGTGPGTLRLTDHAAPAGGLALNWLTAVGSQLFFFMRFADQRTELWKSDGTVPGTIKVKTLVAGGFVFEPPAAYNGRLFFGLLRQSTTSGHTFGEGLWVSNGTAAGTKEFHAVGDESFASAITASGLRLFWNLEPHGLYRTNGTASTIKKLADVFATSPADVNGTLFFTNRNDDGSSVNYELWTSQGRPSNTQLITWLAEPIVGLTDVDGRLFFVANDSDGEELWVSDGSKEGTRMLMSVFEPHDVDELVDVGGTLYFSAFSNLWKSDGTPTGTEEVYNVSLNPRHMTAVGNSLFFAGSNPGDESGVELWRYVP